jgi:hypothetical protein
MSFPQSSTELELAEKVLLAAIAALAAHGEPDSMIAERTNIVRCAGIEAEDGSYEVRTFLDSEGMLNVFYTGFDIERLAAHMYLHSSECEEEHHILRARSVERQLNIEKMGTE